MQFLAVRDLEMCCEMAGTGDPVLLISGTGGDLRNTPVSANPLTENFSVISYDQRGLGQTTKPDKPYSMSDYADDAVALLDVLDIDRAHVVGISFGGMVAQHMAITCADRLNRMVLCCTSSGGRGRASADLLALAELPEHDRAARFPSLLDTRCEPGGSVPDDLVPILAERAKRVPVTDPNSLMGAQRQLVARSAHDTYDRLGEVSCPTLVIGGRNDGIAPVANLRAIADQIPNAELTICHGGHLFLLQDPSAWPRIIGFLGQ